MSAAARRKMLQTRSALWNPEVSAAGLATCLKRRWFVREVAIAEKMASPRAPPIHVELLMSAAASPALSRWDAFVCRGGDTDEDEAEPERHDDQWSEKIGRVRPVQWDA